MPATPKSQQRGLSRRLKQSSSSNYLTMLSIVQGVALAYLGSVIVSGYARFSMEQWLMSLFTFFLYIVIWNQILMDTTAFVMVPDFGDAILPFAAGGVELFAAQGINLVSEAGISVWLWTLATGAFFSIVGQMQFRIKARREPENAALLANTHRRRRFCLTYQAGISTIAITLAIGTVIEGYGKVSRAHSMQAEYAVLIDGGLLICTALMSIYYWQGVVAFSRSSGTGHADRACSTAT